MSPTDCGVSPKKKKNLGTDLGNTYPKVTGKKGEKNTLIKFIAEATF